MSPQMRRYMPLILIGFLFIFIVPQLFNRGDGGDTLSNDERAALTQEAANRIGRAQAASLTSTGAYTGNLSDLVQGDKRLAETLTVPLTVDIDVGNEGRSYFVRVSSDVLSVARSAVNGKVTISTCRALSSKVECAAGTGPGTQTTTTG